MAGDAARQHLRAPKDKIIEEAKSLATPPTPKEIDELEPKAEELSTLSRYERNIKRRT